MPRSPASSEYRSAMASDRHSDDCAPTNRSLHHIDNTIYFLQTNPRGPVTGGGKNCSFVIITHGHAAYERVIFKHVDHYFRASLARHGGAKANIARLLSWVRHAAGPTKCVREAISDL
jgi:hypothetical protein